mmetsp:Transcript_92787/g.207785  ORF Transcript_92787/g.207785 Transcript_92787/m.207785 type:complete len:219 (+) Transcript_92787:398-1054(+)
MTDPMQRADVVNYLLRVARLAKVVGAHHDQHEVEGAVVRQSLPKTHASSVCPIAYPCRVEGLDQLSRRERAESTDRDICHDVRQKAFNKGSTVRPEAITLIPIARSEAVTVRQDMLPARGRPPAPVWCRKTLRHRVAFSSLSHQQQLLPAQGLCAFGLWKVDAQAPILLTAIHDPTLAIEVWAACQAVQLHQGAARNITQHGSGAPTWGGGSRDPTSA